MDTTYGQSIEQSKMVLQNCATKARASRKAALELANVSNAIKENYFKKREAELDAQILEKEAGCESCPLKKKRKLFEAERVRNSFPVEYKYLVKDAIRTHAFFSNYLKENPCVSLEEFERQEKDHFKCRHIIATLENQNVPLSQAKFPKETENDPAVIMIMSHMKDLEEFKANFVENVVPQIQYDENKILMLDVE